MSHNDLMISPRQTYHKPGEAAMHPNPLKRALLARSGALGDFVLSLRVIQALRAAGAEHVAVLGRPAIANAALGRGVDAVIDSEGEGCHLLHGDAAAIPEKVRRQLSGYDLAILMTARGAESALCRNLAELAGGRIICLASQPRIDCVDHITDQWLGDLRAEGIAGEVGYPEIRVSREERERAREIHCLPPDQTLIIIHPGSGGRAKCWPADQYRDLAIAIKAPDRTISFLIGPVEEETMSPAEISTIAAAGQVLRGLPLHVIRDLLASADLFLGNDSGVAHLAAAVGTPTVAVFGPTDPRIWRPLGDHATSSGGCGKWPSVDEVLEEALRML